MNTETLLGPSKSIPQYNPNDEVKELWKKVQQDYFDAYALQNRPFEEFDMLSLLERMNQDQQTFGAFVGLNWEPTDRAWRWKGRKNTARNKIIGILAHIISGMLFPYVYAYNEENKEDEMTAKVMSLLVENHLKKADYEMKFLFSMLSALVNPATFMNVEYLESTQKINIKEDGKWKVEEVVDTILTGINLNMIPCDQILLGDFYTFDIQRQPYIVKSRRVSYVEARSLYSGKYFQGNKDVFEFVKMGDMTQTVGAGRDNQTINSIDWTLADQNFVQELTFYYKSLDLEVCFVGGVLMGNYDDPIHTNPFKKRRVTVTKKGKYVTSPIYPFAKTGFEPIDPNGRFAYYKSAAFKEYWDDASQNRMYQLAQDGTFLDVFKPIFGSGIASIDTSVMVPGAFIGMPQGASVTPYQLGPNVNAALALMRQNMDDMSLSTQDALQSGVAEKGVTATASLKAEQNAKIIMNVFSTMVAQFVKDIGELVMDDIILHTTVGELDATVPTELKVKYDIVRLKTKDGGREVSNIIEFDPNMDLPTFTKEKANELSWKMFNELGGMESKTNKFLVNPYKFAKTQFTCYIDPEVILSKTLGTDQTRKMRAFQLLADPRIAPYVDMEAVVDKFVLQEYSDGDPDQFKAKPEQKDQMAQAMMGNKGPIPTPMNPNAFPVPTG
tara:strand:+ start:6938 stop:8941 length:2004 start_codon:yes stop_codon:yes gene_type:complete